MAAPTYAFAAASNFSDTANDETVAASWGAGDDIYVLGMTADQGVTYGGVPTVAGLTFAPLANTPSATANSCKAYGWKATAAAPGSGTITATRTGGTNSKGISAWVVSAGTSTGSGTPVVLTGAAKTVSVPRGGANSAVIWIGGDWSADTDVAVTANPAGGTARLGNGTTTFGVVHSGQATYFAFDWPDQGAIGTTSYGIANASGTGTITHLVVEILGTGSAPPIVSPLQSLGPSYAAHRAASI